MIEMIEVVMVVVIGQCGCCFRTWKCDEICRVAVVVVVVGGGGGGNKKSISKRKDAVTHTRYHNMIILLRNKICVSRYEYEG